jgi:hypothetical protein
VTPPVTLPPLITPSVKECNDGCNALNF